MSVWEQSFPQQSVCLQVKLLVCCFGVSILNPLIPMSCLRAELTAWGVYPVPYSPILLPFPLTITYRLALPHFAWYFCFSPGLVWAGGRAVFVEGHKL